MFSRIAEWYARKQVTLGEIQNEDIDVYKYGYILMFEMAINICISTILAILLQNVKCLFMFSCIFIPLRMYCGGWHASKSWACSVISNTIIVFVMIIDKYQIIRMSLLILMIVEMICFVIMFWFAPLENENKPLNIIEKKKYKVKCKKIYIMQSALLIFLMCIGYLDLAQIEVMAHILNAISMIAAQLVKNKTCNI